MVADANLILPRPPRVQPTQFPFSFTKINLVKSNELAAIIRSVRSKFCVHLAAMSSVRDSWIHPEKSLINNTNIFLNLVEAIRLYSPETRLLSVGSSEQYEAKGKQSSPLSESDRLMPLNPYAVARCAQELLGRIYVTGFGLDILMTRSFNHVGPRQDSRPFFLDLLEPLLKLLRRGCVRLGCLLGTSMLLGTS